MAATVQIYSMHGSGAYADTTTDVGHMRFKLADDDTVDTNDPCRIPTDDQVNLQEIPSTYSFIKHLKLFVHPGLGPTNSISNLRFFLDGNELGTGISLWGDSTTLYHAPNTQDSTGDVTCTFAIVTPGTPTGSAGVYAAWTKATPLVVNAGEVWGAAADGEGDQNFVILQTRILSTASPGTYPAADDQGVVSYRYDEN